MQIQQLRRRIAEEYLSTRKPTVARTFIYLVSAACSRSLLAPWVGRGSRQSSVVTAWRAGAAAPASAVLTVLRSTNGCERRQIQQAAAERRQQVASTAASGPRPRCRHAHLYERRQRRAGASVSHNQVRIVRGRGLGDRHIHGRCGLAGAAGRRAGTRRRRRRNARPSTRAATARR